MATPGSGESGPQVGKEGPWLERGTDGVGGTSGQGSCSGPSSQGDREDTGLGRGPSCRERGRVGLALQPRILPARVGIPKAPVSRASGELSAAVQTPWRFCESDDISPYKHTHAHLHVKLSIKYEGVQGLPKPRLWTCELRCPASLQAGRRGLVLPWALQTQHLQKGCGNAQALKKVLLTP